MGRTKVPASKKAVSKPQKRKRPSYEPTFFNDQAKKLFFDHMKKREGVRERGIIAQYAGIINIIVRRRWQRFTEQPQPAVLDVVREFYANARVQYNADINSRTVLVRGQDVSYASSNINSFYGLEDFETDEYSAWMSGNPDCDEVLVRLCFPNSTWKTQNGKPISFKRSQLTSISRGWHYFISAKLLPTNHVSDVTRERALLNYAIQSRMTINVGKIIEESIVNCCTGKLNVHLVHPSLIYQLCVAAGVESVDEEEQIPLPVINDATMEVFEKTSSASRRSREKSPFTDTAHPEHEDPINTVYPDQERPAPATTPVTPASEEPSSSTLVETRLRNIMLQLVELQKGQNHLLKVQDILYKGQAKMKKKLSFVIKYGIHIGELMSKANMFEGVTGVRIPPLPTDSSESSEEGDETEEEDSGTKADKADKDDKTDEEASGSKAAKGNEANASSSETEEGSRSETNDEGNRSEKDGETSGSKADE